MKKIFVILLVIFLIGCARKIDNSFNEISIDNGKNLIKINVEVADDDNEKITGLMFREKLEENSGMLFVFDSENYQTFWMKNTLIPLDIIFIGKDFKIIDIKTAVPCKKDPCALYRPSEPAKYVLEVNGNFTIENDIGIGDKIALNQ